jgi:hypothetical protein
MSADDYDAKDLLSGDRQKRADLEYLTRLINRKLLCWWD